MDIGEKEVYHPNVLIDGELKAANLLIVDGRIKSIRIGERDLESEEVPQFGILMPGMADIHVHINEPGNTDWEGFDTATRAAAAGGVTTIIDMPLNSLPVTTTLAAFEEKLQASEGKRHVNVGFWGGVVPGNLEELSKLIEAGVLGFKAFLVHSGLDAFPNADLATLKAAMPVIEKAGLPLLVHAELEHETASTEGLDADPQSADAWLASRPQAMEISAIESMIALCKQTNCRTHIVHLSAAEALPAISAAMEQGLPLTVETAPHYLFFASEDILDGEVQYKCAPPIREHENNLALLEAVKEGIISMIGTDHSPAPAALKQMESGNFLKAWGGIASLQLMLPVLWTLLGKEENALSLLTDLCITKPYQFLGLTDRKGKIEVGYDADFVIWQPDWIFGVEAQDLKFRHPDTCPYLGEVLSGKVLQTYVNGELVFDQDEIVQSNAGKIIYHESKRTS